MANSPDLEVRLYGRPIGKFILLDSDGTHFSFYDDYIDDKDRPVLSIGFNNPFGELRTRFRVYNTRVMPFFSNLLPEGALREYLAAEVKVNSEREFFLLNQLGSDLPGAITIRPFESQLWSSKVTEQIQKNQTTQALRFSLAGVQLKFSAILNASGGLTIPVNGIGGKWIVKLPSKTFKGVPENEFSMLTLARLAGMDVPAIKLVYVDEIENVPKKIETLNGQALAVARFDRLGNGRAVHSEDFAQIFGIYPEKKYQYGGSVSIARVISKAGRENDILEFVKRLTFNALIGNADMHLKNWSLIYPNRRNAMLAPAYDFVSTICYISDEKLALNVSRTKLFSRFSEDELKHFAAKASLPEKMVIDTARETVELFFQIWQAEKENLPLTRHMIDAIDAHSKSIPIAQKHGMTSKRRALEVD